MGITIRWKGYTESKETAKQVIQYATFFAESLGWNVRGFTEKGYATQEEDIEFLTFYTKEQVRELNIKTKDMEESTNIGIVINPPKPFETESIVISFFNYKNKFWIKNFCKTQVFGEEELPNLVAHQIIINLLKTIKETWIPNLEIYDEGEFYETNNFKVLSKNHGSNLALINKAIKILTS